MGMFASSPGGDLHESANTAAVALHSRKIINDSKTAEKRIKIAPIVLRTVRIPLSIPTVQHHRGNNHMTNTNLKLVSPAKENRTVTPLRRPNADLRPREHLTEREVDKMIEAAKGNRWGQRDSTMLLIAFRHGLRASELCALQWSDVEFETGTLHLRRAKGGVTATHPLLGDELRALRALKREAKSPFIFVSETGVLRSRLLAWPSWSSGQASRLRCLSSAIRTCCAMPPALRWRTRAPTRGR